MTTQADISAYLEVLERHDNKNWTWNYVQAGAYWHVKYDGVTPSCELNIGLTNSVLCIHIDLSALHPKPDCCQAFYHFLLRLNDDLSIVKFGLGQDGKLALMAEAPASQLGLGAFEELLRRIIAVFAQYRRELALLAGEAELAQLLLKLNLADDRSTPLVRVVD